MKKKLSTSMTDTTPFWKIAQKFDLNFNELSVILVDYIKNGNTELYYLRMSNLCGVYEPFIRQNINSLIVECQDLYMSLGEIETIKLTGNKLIIQYEDLDNETSGTADLYISELWNPS